MLGKTAFEILAAGSIALDIVVICASILLITALILLTHWQQRRPHRRIGELMAADGRKVVRIYFTAIPSMCDVVEYIGAQGELRQAVLVRGGKAFSDDRPYQTVLKERFGKECTQMLGLLKLAAASARLPGRDQYLAIARSLAAGTVESLRIDELTPMSNEATFAPVMQCLEAAAIGSKNDDPLVLELTVDGKRLDLKWWIEGISPNRTLMIAKVQEAILH